MIPTDIIVASEIRAIVSPKDALEEVRNSCSHIIYKLEELDGGIREASMDCAVDCVSAHKPACECASVLA
ncbi:hypothetical protein COMA1_11103 [Candidatus Nitrospira nitrosa]|mgnify:CR=1 FL=1|uniref:Uncharacterized protein n=1 Tax=Candidatus Nitrospira nitrosa TaxID=1742972 RepID=A0A0S4L6B9_9BACT|nr:hypothetical protein COMA1_11103 [Candidatus Nitrospira nitrosa]